MIPKGSANNIPARAAYEKDNSCLKSIACKGNTPLPKRTSATQRILVSDKCAPPFEMLFSIPPPCFSIFFYSTLATQKFSLFFQKALAFSRPLCYNNKRFKATLSGLTVCFTQKHASDNAAIRELSCKSFSDNLIFFMEKYSSGEQADRRRWRMKGGERVAAVKIWRSEQRATNFGHRNRIEEA